MKSWLVMGLALISIALNADAATSLDGPIRITPGLEQFIVNSSDGRSYLQIDDMLIPVDTGEKAALWGTTWTNGIVYYQFDANVGAANRAAWLAAAMEWQATVPGLTFLEGSGAGNYILVYSSTVNNSAVGMAGGAQTMNIHDWDWRFIIAHEIGHALGLMHEQSRNDRDTSITVNFENIQDAMELNYSIFGGTTDHGIYDYGSVMHYSRCGFWDPAVGSCGTDGHTMDATAAGAAAAGMTTTEANDSMGQRSDLSAGDIAGIRALYPGGSGLVFGSCFENGRTNAWSSVTGEVISCAHDACETGLALDAQCDSCVGQICAYDSYCCGTQWDSICVGYVISICEGSCS